MRRWPSCSWQLVSPWSRDAHGRIAALHHSGVSLEELDELPRCGGGLKGPDLGAKEKTSWDRPEMDGAGSAISLVTLPRAKKAASSIDAPRDKIPISSPEASKVGMVWPVKIPIARPCDRPTEADRLGALRDVHGRCPGRLGPGTGARPVIQEPGTPVGLWERELLGL